MIVVGDSKQMPPSNFFVSIADQDEDDEDYADAKDFESVLDLCSTVLPQLRLKWHYRSRYESLIDFSNKQFYDGDLVTFPSSKVDAAGIGVGIPSAEAGIHLRNIISTLYLKNIDIDHSPETTGFHKIPDKTE